MRIVSSSTPRLRASRSGRTRVSSFMGYASSSRFSVGGDAVARQVLTHLRGILELNRMHSQFLGDFEIEAAIVNEYAFLWRRLREAKRHAVDFLVRLAHAQVAGTQEGFEVPAKFKRPNTMFVDFARFV